MSSGEHSLLGWIFLATILAFFALALPAYWLLRSLLPEMRWHNAGNVSTSSVRRWDLISVAVLALFFFGQWVANKGQVIDPGSLTPEAILASSAIFLFLAAMIPALLFRRVNLIEHFGIRWTEWWWIFLIVPVFLVVIYLFSALMMQAGWHDWATTKFGGGRQEAVDLLTKTNNPGLILAMVFSAVIVAPIAEEIIFRGYLYPVAKRYTDSWFAAVFSGLFFGVVHLNLLGFPMLALIGIALAFIYEKTGSIWPAIACHMAFNGMTIGVIILLRFLNIPIPA